MAVIKIPSKHIYSIDNQKVIDNQVDKIEVQSARVVPDNHYNEPVYNGIAQGEYDINSEKYSDGDSRLLSSVVSMTNPIVYCNSSFIYEDNQYYINKIINIPIQLDNKHIVRSLLLGIGSDGTKRIKYSCSGKIISGKTDALVLLTATVSGAAVSSWKCSQIPAMHYYDSIEKIDQYDILNEYKNKIDFESGYSLTAKIEPKFIDNLGDITAKEVSLNGLPYLQLDLKNILCGIRIVRSGGQVAARQITSGSSNLSGTGGHSEYEEYIPESVTITIYGNTIGIDLKNEIVTIGNGSHIMSFSGNELMQTTNSPSIQSNYIKIIEQYKNGKEVAALRCGIEDYYDADSQDIEINILSYSRGSERYIVSIETDYPIVAGGVIYLNNGDRLDVLYKFDAKTWSCATSFDTILNIGKQHAVFGNKIISKRRENSLPMTLHIGDFVVPYVYGANGADKPMSVRKNGTAKQFEVLGKKVIYDGGVWQEIAIQETLDRTPPSEYQAIEWLESSGIENIDTGIAGTNRVGFDIMFVSKDDIASSKYGCVFGARNSSKVNEIQLTSYISNDTPNYRGTFRYGTDGYYSAGFNTSAAGGITRSTFIGNVYTGKDIAETISKQEFGSGKNITIFALNQDGGVTQFGKVRLYYFKLYYDEVLVRDYIPAYRKKDGKAGLYDLVNKQFYIYGGNDNFIKGPDVNSL